MTITSGYQSHTQTFFLLTTIRTNNITQQKRFPDRKLCFVVLIFSENGIFRNSNREFMRGYGQCFLGKKSVQQVGRNSNREFLRGYGQCFLGKKKCAVSG